MVKLKQNFNIFILAKYYEFFVIGNILDIYFVPLDWKVIMKLKKPLNLIKFYFFVCIINYVIFNKNYKK